jgi:hypothetical protein
VESGLWGGERMSCWLVLIFVGGMIHLTFEARATYTANGNIHGDVKSGIPFAVHQASSTVLLLQLSGILILVVPFEPHRAII